MTQSTLNFVDTATVTWSITDDTVNSRYDIQADAVIPAPPASIGAEVRCSSPVAHLTPGTFTQVQIAATNYSNGITVVPGIAGYFHVATDGMYVLAAGLRFTGVNAGDYTDVGFQVDSGAGPVLVGRTQQATGALTFIGSVFAEPSVSYIARLFAGNKVYAGGSYWGSSGTANWDAVGKFAILRVGDVIP